MARIMRIAGSAVACIALLSVLSRGARLAKPGSTHPSFPMDAFAKPAFELVFDDANAISNQTAIELLQAHEQYLKSKQDDGSVSQYDAAGAYKKSQVSKDQSQLYLHRSSPSTLHLCSITQPREDSPSDEQLNDNAVRAQRRQIVENALKLLAPLKDVCLYHTIDWFTYSLCYGDAIKQFRALSGTNNGLVAPAVDPNEDSYVLGRWNDQIEGVKDSDFTADQAQKVAEIEGSRSGTELMELVHFQSIEGAAITNTELREGTDVDAQQSVAGRGRYISQTWTDGTKCIINNEMRTTEVQYHCSNSPPIDRIALIKEVTTCSYIIVVHTPRLCAEPALAQAKEEVGKVHCQPILSDAELESRRLALEQKKTLALGSIEMPAVELVAAPSEAPVEEESKGIEAEVQKTIKSFVESINQAGNGVQIEQVNVVMTRNEDGDLVVQSNGEGAEKIVEMLTNQVENQANDASQTDQPKKPKMNGVLEKLLQHNGQVMDISKLQEILKDAGQGEGEKQQGGKGGAKFVKEKENFPQKVERFYKAQEAKSQSSIKSKEEKKEAAGSANSRSTKEEL